ncbi:hypothetical protein PCE1_000804 [Barthelona sp. PCE]
MDTSVVRELKEKYNQLRSDVCSINLPIDDVDRLVDHIKHTLDRQRNQVASFLEENNRYIKAYSLIFEKAEEMVQESKKTLTALEETVFTLSSVPVRQELRPTPEIQYIIDFLDDSIINTVRDRITEGVSVVEGYPRDDFWRMRENITVIEADYQMMLQEVEPYIQKNKKTSEIHEMMGAKVDEVQTVIDRLQHSASFTEQDVDNCNRLIERAKSFVLRAEYYYEMLKTAADVMHAFSCSIEEYIEYMKSKPMMTLKHNMVLVHENNQGLQGLIRFGNALLDKIRGLPEAFEVAEQEIQRRTLILRLMAEYSASAQANLNKMVAYEKKERETFEETLQMLPLPMQQLFKLDEVPVFDVSPKEINFRLPLLSDDKYNDVSLNDERISQFLMDLLSGKKPSMQDLDQSILAPSSISSANSTSTSSLFSSTSRKAGSPL